MKRFFLPIVFSLIGTMAFAQNPEHKHGLTFRTLWADYYNPNGGDLSDYKNYRYGFSAAYTYNINKYLNLSVPLRYLNVRLKDQPVNTVVWGGDFQLQGQWISGKGLIVPYALLGIGSHVIKAEGADVQIPVGIGVDIRMWPRAYFNIGTEYRFSHTEDRNNFIHGIGFKYLLGKGGSSMDMDGDGVVDSLDLCPTVYGLKAFNGCPDTDGDGVPDNLDECPTVAGPALTNGCPDADKDGIPDKDDLCPNEPGTRENKGCPSLDRDGDGIPDAIDECPDTPGNKSAKGCPDADEDGVPDHLDECPDVVGLKMFNGCPDTDGDGIEDRYDRCPTVPGTKENRGCPDIDKADKEKLEFAMKSVQFELGKTVLLPSSHATLNDIADIMKRYPEYHLEISGHTDPSGKIETNRLLSTNRAKACYNYLVSKGVSTGRMTYAGFGPDRPRYDNSTENGRILNRRVEFSMVIK